MEPFANSCLRLSKEIAEFFTLSARKLALNAEILRKLAAIRQNIAIFIIVNNFSWENRLVFQKSYKKSRKLKKNTEIHARRGGKPQRRRAAAVKPIKFLRNRENLLISRAFDLKNFKCPHCGSKGETLLLKEASFLTYLASLVTLFLFGFFSIILLPLIIQSSKTIVRRCGDCYEILEQHDLFSLPSLSDEVFLRIF